jgi:hypothetical protein
VAGVDMAGIWCSEIELVAFAAPATVAEDSFIEDDSVGEGFSGCKSWGVAVGSVEFAG